MSDKLVVAVVGATSAVGTEMIRALEQKNFPVKTLVPLAAKKKEVRTVTFKKKEIVVQETQDTSFNGVDLTLFAGDGDASKEFGWEAVRRGSLVIDSSSTFRMRPDVPLIVPEVNIRDIKRHKGLIANPGSATIQMVVALKPIQDKLGIERIVVTTLHSVSDMGRDAMEELKKQSKSSLAGKEVKPGAGSKQIAFNCIPHVDVFEDNLYTNEETRIINETRKIFSNPALRITATCVLVPVFSGHAVCVTVETQKKLTIDAVRKMLAKSPGTMVVDELSPAQAAGDPQRRTYPLQIDAVGKDAVMVGRIRKDDSVESGYNLWIVSDNLRKGAALNAVQIAEFLF